MEALKQKYINLSKQYKESKQTGAQAHSELASMLDGERAKVAEQQQSLQKQAAEIENYS